MWRYLNIQMRCSYIEKRRIMLDIMQMYKIVHEIGNVKCNVTLVRDRARAQGVRATRSQADELNIIKERCRLDIRKHFFTNRIADTWNQIPSNIKHITPVHKFKKKLIDWMNTQRLTETD